MYTVVEIQTNADGTVGNIVHAYANRAEAEHEYHLALAAAAISSLPIHAAVLLTNEGFMEKHERYIHEQAEE